MRRAHVRLERADARGLARRAVVDGAPPERERVADARIERHGADRAAGAGRVRLVELDEVAVAQHLGFGLGCLSPARGGKGESEQGHGGRHGRHGEGAGAAATEREQDDLACCGARGMPSVEKRE